MGLTMKNFNIMWVHLKIQMHPLRMRLWVGGAFLLTQISKANNIVTVLLLIILTIIDT